MRLLVAHLLGLALGYGVTMVTLWWFTGREDSDKVIVDVWWLENDQRWLDLAPLLRKERGLLAPPDPGCSHLWTGCGYIDAAARCHHCLKTQAEVEQESKQ